MTDQQLKAANEAAHAELRRAIKEGQPHEIIERLKLTANETDRKVDAI